MRQLTNSTKLYKVVVFLLNLRDISRTHSGMNNFAFFGGVQISTGVSIYVDLYNMNLSTLAMFYLLGGGLLIFLGGYLSMALTWKFSRIIKEGEKTIGTIFDEEEQMDKKLNETISIFGRDIKRITKIRICFYSDVVSTGIGLMLITLSRISIIS